jgi:GNAT superfamily N-acetyltransferase
VEVVELTVGDTYDLRRRVLRDGTPSTDVTYPEDRQPGSFHLGLRYAGGPPVAIATFCTVATPWRPDRRAVQLRGMAVEPGRQRGGLGRALLAAAIERIKADGADVLWASARDSALGFYERVGMEVVGDAYVPDATGLPHHVVVLDLVS